MEFMTTMQQNAALMHENYSALLRAGFTEEQALELTKVALAAAMQIAAGQME